MVTAAEEVVSPVQIAVTAVFDDPAEAKEVLGKLSAVLDVLDLDVSSITRMSTSLNDTNR